MSHFNEHTLEMAIMEMFEQKTASEQAEKRVVDLRMKNTLCIFAES